MSLADSRWEKTLYGCLHEQSSSWEMIAKQSGRRSMRGQKGRGPVRQKASSQLDIHDSGHISCEPIPGDVATCICDPWVPMHTNYMGRDRWASLNIQSAAGIASPVASINCAAHTRLEQYSKKNGGQTAYYF